MRFGKRKQSIIFRLLFPYLLLLIFPLLIGTIVYNKTFGMAEQALIEKNHAVLEQSKTILDQRFAEVEALVQQTVLNTKVISYQYIKNPFSGVLTYKILETKSALTDYTLTNSFVVNYYLLFKNSNLAISPKDTYTLEDFYSQVLHYNNLDFKAWYDQVLGRPNSHNYLPAHNAIYKSKTMDFVIYRQSLGTGNNTSGSIIVLLDNKQIQKLLSSLNISEGGWTYIADKEGHIISSVSSGYEILSEVEAQQSTDLIITKTTSAYNGWSYVTAHPKKIVLHKIGYIKTVTLFIFIVTLLFGVIVAVFLASRNSKPLQAIIRTIRERFDKDPHEGQDVYGFIQNTLTNLLNNNAELNNRLVDQLPHFRSMFMERILKGDFQSKEEALILSKHVGIPLTARTFSIIILQLKGYDETISEDILRELAVKRILVHNLLQHEIKSEHYVHSVDEHKIVLLVMLNELSPNECKKAINHLVNKISLELQDQLNFKASFAAGSLYESPLDLSRSYGEARLALQHNSQSIQSDLVWYDELSSYVNTYYFPPELEQRLINYTHAGNRVEVLNLLDELHYKNFTERHLALQIQHMLQNEIRGSLLKIIEQINLKDKALHDKLVEKALYPDFRENANVFFMEAKQLFFELCNYQTNHKKSHNDKLKDEIIHIIHESYKNSNFSLNYISQQTDMSEVYLSQFFREQTGINFSDYLLDIRMKTAGQLLSATSISIQEIADQCGYNSMNTFGRAFKRMYGISPTIYRNQHNQMEQLS
jgi:two-component system response regulator YesN